MEHGCFVYRYEPCNVGNIRKMLVLLPAITPRSEQLSEKANRDYNQVKGLP